MGTELLQYRLRSVRRKKRIQIEDRDKQILKLDRESKLISKDPDYKTEVLLDEPYQKGWKRLFVLKPDVKRSEKATFYQAILDRINDVQYHYDQSFKRPKRRKYPRGHRYNHETLPKMKSIDRFYWNMNKAKFSGEQRACFNKIEFWDQHYYRWDYRYEFAYPELFEIAVLPHIITTVKIGDALLESRGAYIDDRIYKSRNCDRLAKLKGGWYKYWKSDYEEKPKHANPLKNKPLHAIDFDDV